LTFEVKHPSDIYQRINDELDRIIRSLRSQTNEQALNEAQAGALNRLKKCQEELSKQLAKLEKNAEWNIFTIAFYGETGAGKSSIIETLRILLREPSKLASQQAFRELRDKYSLSEESLQHLVQEIEQASNKLVEITQQFRSAQQDHEQWHKDALSHIDHLQTLIAEHKRTASLWQKLVNWFGKMPEEVELSIAEKQLPSTFAEQVKVIDALISRRGEAERYKLELCQQLQERESHLNELDALADGCIIGDGSSDFTRKIQHYNFEMDGQKFALLDVPGIEGQEELVREEIEHAVQTAHAVFYVTNQAAPPQTGDEQRKGTLEKIKTHLSAQTEVWTLFNKRIVNPVALKSQPLIKDEEWESLTVLDEKMREHLGSHYCEVFPLSALSAFLVSTEHFAPNSQNAKRRRKVLCSFDTDELLEKSRMKKFIWLLKEQLLNNSEAKIKAANFNRAKVKVDEVSLEINHIQQDFGKLTEELELTGSSSCKQLRQSFNVLKQRLESLSGRLVDELVSDVRRPVYRLIDQDISNDTFKSELHRYIERQQQQLNEQLPNAIRTEVEIFQRDVQEIFKHFEEYSLELTSIFGKLGSARINDNFDINIKIGSGINVWGLLGGMAGLVTAPFTGGASLWIAGASLLTSFVSVGKSIWGALSSSYKKSQQRKAVDENLRKISDQLLSAIHGALGESIQEIQRTIKQLEQVMLTPGQQAAVQTQLLKHSVQKLNLLSLQISNAGNLQ
jgi:energy-coupling factor transporter ATP-binding protein EcfA2